MVPSNADLTDGLCVTYEKPADDETTADVDRACVMTFRNCRAASIERDGRANASLHARAVLTASRQPNHRFTDGSVSILNLLCQQKLTPISSSVNMHVLPRTLLTYRSAVSDAGISKRQNCHRL